MGNPRLADLDCLQCGEAFTPTHFNQKLCSDHCRLERNKCLCRQCDRNNTAKRRAYNARHYAEKSDYWRDKSFKDRYGLSLDDAKKRLDAQGGVCPICLSVIDLHAKGVNAPNKGHMDHCHDSGKPRGILCRECNWGLGNFKDDPERVEAAASYLREWSDAE